MPPRILKENDSSNELINNLVIISQFSPACLYGGEIKLQILTNVHNTELPFRKQAPA